MGVVLSAGTDKADITPSGLVPLAGFKHRKEPASGIEHPLYARIAWFRTEDGTRIEEALLVSADLIWWGPDRMARLRAAIRERYGLPEDRIVLHATHTHGSPQTSRSFLSALGECSGGYVAFLENSVLEGIGRARQAQEPVRWSRGKGRCTIGINRRKAADGTVIMAPNPEGPVDPEVTILLLSREDGTVKSAFVHYACHPTTTGDNLVTSEFPGIAMEEIENHLGNGAVSFYLQGCCGDIRPNLAENGEFYRGTETDVVSLGKTLAGCVIRELSGDPACLEAGHLQSRRTGIVLDYQQDNRGNWREALQGMEEWPEWQSDPLKEEEHRRMLDITLLTLAPGLSILAMNGEMAAEYGLYAKRLSGGAVLPVAYSNGMIGYVPSAAQLGEGGYEPWESILFFRLPAPFDPVVESVIKEEIRNLVQSVDIQT